MLDNTGQMLSLYIQQQIYRKISQISEFIEKSVRYQYQGIFMYYSTILLITGVSR